MAQAAAIRDAINPDEVLFVLDARTRSPPLRAFGGRRVHRCGLDQARR